MRRLVATATILALAWGGSWLAGRAVLEHEAGRALAGELAAGRLEALPELHVAGFPGRFDLFLDRIALAGPGGGIAFRTTDLRARASLLRPWRLEVALPRHQSLVLAEAGLAIAAEGLEAALAVRLRPSLPLDRVQVAGTGLRLAGPGGTVTADDLAGSLAAEAGEGARYRLALVLGGIRPGPALEGAAAGPPAADAGPGTLALDLGLRLSAPLDRHAGQSQPRLLVAELDGLDIALGALRILARGRVEAGPDGLAEGRIEMRVAGWRALPGRLAALGVIGPGLVPTLGRLLEAYAAQQQQRQRQAGEEGADGTLTIALRFRNGWAFLGPIPLGPAPRLAP